MVREVFVSTDVEADGPIPGMYSMLSFASAAYLPDKTLIDTFSANLETLPYAIAHPKTMKWWRTQPDAWAACRTGLEEPKKAMKRYQRWIKHLPGRPIFVAYPASFDFLFVNWYLIRFTGRSPFKGAVIDIRSYAMAMLKTYYGDTMKDALPPEWFDADLPHTHIALDDAKEHGATFCNMLAANGVVELYDDPSDCT